VRVPVYGGPHDGANLIYQSSGQIIDGQIVQLDGCAYTIQRVKDFPIRAIFQPIYRKQDNDN